MLLNNVDYAAYELYKSNYFLPGNNSYNQACLLVLDEK